MDGTTKQALLNEDAPCVPKVTVQSPEAGALLVKNPKLLVARETHALQGTFYRFVAQSMQLGQLANTGLTPSNGGISATLVSLRSAVCRFLESRAEC